MQRTRFVFTLKLLCSVAFLEAFVPSIHSETRQENNSKLNASREKKLSAEEVFRISEASVFVVKVSEQNGRLACTGSGVAISSNEIVTNKHVVACGSVVRIAHGQKSWPATITHVFPNRDLVKLKVLGLSLKAVPTRNSDTLSVGEKAFTIGAPQGFENTLSEGLISGIRVSNKFIIIQTSAPISHGSSGGGLFDESANLIGIISLIHTGGQALNFALPAQLIQRLNRYPVKSTPPLGSSAFLANLKFQLGATKIEMAKEFPVFARQFYKDAILYLKGAFKQNPTAATATKLGYCYQLTQKLDKAAAAYNQAIKINLRYSPGFEGLAYVYELQGKRAKALAVADKLKALGDSMRERRLLDWLKKRPKSLGK